MLSSYPSIEIYLTLAIAFFLLGYGILTFPRRKYRGLRPLPAPPRNIIGGHENALISPCRFMVFDKWAREYGPIFQVRVGPQTIICVNDPRIAKELFEKRGAKYSSRSSPYVAYELLSQKRRIVLTPNGPMHTAFRRQLHAILSISKTKQNLKTQELESRQLLLEFIKFSEGLGQPENPPDYGEPQSIIRRYTLSVMMTLSFGHRIKSLDDPIVRTVFDIMDDIAIASQPGQYLVDMFPILKRLPYFFKTWEHKSERKVEWQWAFLNDLLMRTEKQMNAGTPNIGLIRALIEQRQGMSEAEKDQKFLDEKSIAYQAQTLMEAGSDTTAITAMNFLLAMVLHPDIMRKGQESVDAVVPASRLPEFEDLESMPYINQIVKEVMRWRPVLPLGVPHLNTTDDDYDGYHIPANSMIVGNMWFMQHDSAHYTNPSEFSPERFEESKGKSAFESSIEADAMGRDHYVFGWGRRICPGMHLAEASMLLLVSRILWGFHLSTAKDKDGRDIKVTADPEKAYTHSAFANPKAFPMSLSLRCKERGEVIRKSYQDALKTWSEMKLDLFREA